MLACLIGVHGKGAADQAFVLEHEGRTWAFKQSDLDESCARCRGASQENWKIYKEAAKHASVSKMLLALLVKNDELDDPNLIRQFTRTVPVVRLDGGFEKITKRMGINNRGLKDAFAFATTLLRHHTESKK